MNDNSGPWWSATEPDDVVIGFATARDAIGMTLYPAQEEAILGLAEGANVVLSTPTGTGKSQVAIAGIGLARSAGRRAFYTAPIKALVAEKYAELVAEFGETEVGMISGDASVNADAPIIACTAEILAHLAMRDGAAADVDLVVMDEFHYYADRDRGWAWQLPLLTLPRAQFLLMSATLGDVSRVEVTLVELTGRPVIAVTGVERPVPLTFRYATSDVAQTVQDLLDEKLAPIYIVHSAQLEAVERAQALATTVKASREDRDAIAAAVAGFPFTTAFGTILSRLVRAGIGVHHAGMLPRYRRLVEQLAQRGLLRVICGTDTLGVGINVPIRTVLLTSLTKFDGTRQRRLSAREFHQLSGRAGRAGYDTAGTVVAQAPDHEVANVKAVAKAGDDERKRKKIVRKSPAAGSVSWSEQTLERIVDAPPEPLTSRFSVTHALVLALIGREDDPVAEFQRLLAASHETPQAVVEHRRRALGILRTLVTTGVVDRIEQGGRVSLRLMVDAQPSFALNQPLAPFAVAALELLDANADTYALDVVSVIESILDDPRPIVLAQQHAARGEAIAAMKADGIEYDERMEIVQEITWPQPLAELLETTFATFATSQPWARDHDLHPKSVVRDMWERAMDFPQFVRHYSLVRSEGVVLRYLADADRALRQSVPQSRVTEELADLMAWLHDLVQAVDSSTTSWLPAGDGAIATAVDVDAFELVRPVTADQRAFTVMVRNALFRRVRLFAADDLAGLRALDAVEKADHDLDMGGVDWEAALDAYFDRHDEVLLGPDARGPGALDLQRGSRTWVIRQRILDPAGDGDFSIVATVDLAASDAAGTALVQIVGAGLDVPLPATDPVA